MSDSSVTRFLPRPDPGTPVSCTICGCRLVAATGSEDGAWRHFPSLAAGQDARGCRPACVDELHGDDGRVFESASSADAAAA
ncbi:hypothetical protein BH23CHL6_BH23CHL6_06520 [soil metagenome]